VEPVQHGTAGAATEDVVVVGVVVDDEPVGGAVEVELAAESEPLFDPPQAARASAMIATGALSAPVSRKLT
jgi:hypothetical protein